MFLCNLFKNLLRGLISLLLRLDWRVKKGCVLGGSSYVSDKIFGQNERQSRAFGNLRGDNDFADVTLACEDGQQGEAHKVILAGQTGRSSLIIYLTVNITSTSAVGTRLQVSRCSAATFSPYSGIGGR